MLQLPLRRVRPLRLIALLVPAGVAFYVLACGDASNTDAQNYFSDSPIQSTQEISDGGPGTTLSDGQVIARRPPDVYVPPVYDSGPLTHDGTVLLTSTMTNASVDLLSTVTIPLTIASQGGFEGSASLLALSPPNNLGVAVQPDSVMVTPAVAGTATLVITTKNYLAPGPLTVQILAYAGSSPVDAGTPVSFAITVNPRVTIDIPLNFAAAQTNFSQINIGYANSIPSNPVKVVFTNQDTSDWFLVGADGANAGFPNGSSAIGPGKTEGTVSGTDAGSARVIDQKATVHYWAAGYGTSESIAESGGGTDGGNKMPYMGTIIVN